MHLYDGYIDQSMPCATCNKPANSRDHKFNAGIPCDVERGPCACGAWHGTLHNFKNAFGQDY